MRDNQRIVIVGGNAAGMSVLSGLRRFGFGGEVTVVEPDPEPPYERPALSKRVLFDDVSASDIPLVDPSLLEDQTVRVKDEVIGIDLDAKRLMLLTGVTIPYDTLVLATGAKAIAPKIDSDGSVSSLTLRTWSDAIALKEMIAQDAIAVIGGGVIGCEAAVAAKQAGADVTLIEAEGQLMARAFDEAIGDHARDTLLALGVKIHFNSYLTALTNKQAVISPSGKFDVQHALFGVGAKPNTLIAEQAGLECDNGVLVDTEGRTSDTHVFAVGDVACGPFGWQGRFQRHESQTAAQDQGIACAAAIVSQSPQHWVPYVWSDQGETHYAQIGWRPDGSARAIRAPDDGSGSSVILHFSDEKLAGASLINAGRELSALRRLIGAPLKQLPDITDPKVSLRELVRQLRKAA